ncbi:hypothetical protein [Rhodococcus opacus]|uniref:Uncharacterized protein n=1 Tax=Rhodococcus opacus TaxID=37919 RepID=A0A2S8JAV9_RHOOP|nr:hypothetical protein [Rhodococcus opacus]PQP24140.1 hypothetical protein C5613_14770 [Rhodococcus opacus]
MARPRKYHGCTVDECERPHAARGLCSLHYERWKRNGTTDGPAIRPTATARCSEKQCKRLSVQDGLCRGHSGIEEAEAHPETWAPVVGFEKRWFVSTRGRVWTIPPMGGRGVFVETQTDPDTREKYVLIFRSGMPPLRAPIRSLVSKAFAKKAASRSQIQS